MKKNYGMYNYFNIKGNQEYIPDLIRKVGFDRIMLWWGEYLFYDDDIKYKLAEKSLKIGLNIENIHAPYKIANILWEGHVEDYNLAYQIYKKGIIDCNEYKIPTMVIHLTRTNNLPQYNNVVIYRVCKLLEIAEKYEVNIALENLKYIEYIDYLFDRIDSERLLFCYDSGHAFCYNPKVDFFSKYPNKLVTTHFHDNDGLLDEHKIVGDGKIEWNLIVKRLKDINYLGSFNFECNMKSVGYSMSDEEFLKKVYKAGKKLLE